MAGLPDDVLAAIADELPAGMLQSLDTFFEHPELDEAPQEDEVEEEENPEWISDKFPSLDTMALWEGEAPPPSMVVLEPKRLQHRHHGMARKLPPTVLVGEEVQMVEEAPSQRQCKHCAVQETSRWRTGPDGPRTLCNTCGARYSQGRLVPEYRPKKRPTLLLSQRKCRHCAAEETPQWRIGPEGPQILCNACGIMYYQGQLLPEYRPVISPTFVPEQHTYSRYRIKEISRLKHSSNAEDPVLQSQAVDPCGPPHP